MSFSSRTDIINFFEIHLLVLLLIFYLSRFSMAEWLLVIKNVLLSWYYILSPQLANSRDVIFSCLTLVLLWVHWRLIIKITYRASLHVVYLDLFSLVIKWIINEVLLAFISFRKPSNYLLVNKDRRLIVFEIVDWRLIWFADCWLVFFMRPVVLVEWWLC